MHIKFTSIPGGILGVANSKGCELDTEVMSEQDAKELDRMVSESGLLDVEEAPANEPSNGTEYTLEIDKKDRSIKIVVTNLGQQSVAIRALITLLIKRSQPLKY